MNRREFVKCCAAGCTMLAASGLGCGKKPIEYPKLARIPRTLDRFALVNVKVVDVETGQVLPQKALLINRTQIEAIIDEDTPFLATIPRVDCEGGYMIPGLINAHCHITMFSVASAMVVDGGPVLRQVFRNYEDSITWGVTTVRDLGGAPKFLKRHRVAIDQRVLAGPHILSSIGFLAVPGGYPDFLAGFPKIAQAAVGAPVLYATSPEQARDHVKRYYDEGADVIKIAFDHKSIGIHHNALNVLSDAQIEAIKDEAGLKGLPVAAHHQYTEGFETGLRHNIDSMEHVVTVSKLSDQQILRAADSKIPFIPTLTSRLNLAFKSENDAYSSDPGLNKRLQFRKEKMFPDIPNHCSRRIATLCERYIEHYQTGQYVDPKFKRGMALDPSFFTRGMVLGTQNLSRMIEAGVVIGVGNDSGVPLTFPGMLHFEMELLVGAGMTPAQVLRAATAVNAKICNVSKQCGTIEKGKRADLVLLEKNPIEDIANVAKVRAVFKNGRIVSKVPTFKYRYLPPKRS